MKNTIKRFQSLFKPELFHGWGKSKRFFEGWYYKLIAEESAKAFAIIPGIAMDKDGSRQAFIQVLDGKARTSDYIKFDHKDFHPHNSPFNISIKNNHFKLDEIILDLPLIKGHLEFRNLVPWPTSWKSPGIMGPYSFVPFMECYHGILSMDHEIYGTLKIKNDIIDFTGGRGYMEKDWGKSFPSAYTWMQTNHFSQEGISFKASVAKIPWLGSSFVGFIAGVLLKDKLIQFTTYNSSKIRKCLIDKDRVELLMENKHHQLEVLAHRELATELASPILGLMDGKIEESMSSKIDIKLFDKKNNKILLDDTGRNTALEVAGDIKEILS